MGNIAYLLGAGASAERIPTVMEMKKQVYSIGDDCLSNIRSKIHSGEILPLSDHDKIIDLLEKDFKYLELACKNYSSIDTFAKKLFLTKDSDFERLKIILSFYFTYVQIAGLPDLRYDNFWASLLNNIDTLPQNIRILSWNYDFQLEQSFINMSGSPNLLTASDKLNSYNVNKPEIFKPNEFGLFKINGSARFSSGKEDKDLFLYEGKNEDNFSKNLTQLTKAYQIIKTGNRYKSMLSFAWETNHEFTVGKPLYEFLSNIDTLAIIGYSFPVFNRVIDKKILSLLNVYSHIYIQDFDPESIKERIEQIYNTGNIKFTLVKNTTQFVFPIEI